MRISYREKCGACDAEGWQCERRAHTEGTYHATGLREGEEPVFEDGKPTNADRAWLGTVKWRETSNRILDCLMMAEAPLRPAQVADELGLSSNTVRKHLSILRKEELAWPRGTGLWSA